MVKNKTKNFVPTPKKKFMSQVSKEAKTVQSVPLPKNKLQNILKKKQSSQPSKSEIKQTTPNKKKSSELPAIQESPSH
ncbi:hypothetical protein C5167_043536 [Papaver somniferum]|uniref:Uncharacterized protein n=1 Tax=Papaver somniferum TaxID=3469 RepID=A0A4Y7L6W9_PAPSO|nr:hypothetical protein C5167_043536 [Papaver somniferum]